jgi:hypothetical protein
MMKSLMTKLDPRLIYLVLTLGALAAAAGAGTDPNGGWSFP